MTCQTALFLGVYALGAANAGERLLVEAHLPDCAECRAELARLAPLPGLLARVPAELVTANGTAVGAASAPAGVAHSGPVPSRRAGARIGSVRPRWAVALAAAAAAGGLALGLVLAPAAVSRPATVKPAVVLSGASRLTHVYATAALTATSWGTSIQLRASGIPENVLCRLIVHSRSGATEVAGVWEAWSTGPVAIPASAGLRPSDIADLQVRTATRTLLTIPAGRR
jgi:hypothetical protein